jgi:hypothetical protein
MGSKMPPVPPAGRSRKGPGGETRGAAQSSKATHPRDNSGEQGRHGGVQTSHQQGRQQGK